MHQSVGELSSVGWGVVPDHVHVPELCCDVQEPRLQGAAIVVIGLFDGVWMDAASYGVLNRIDLAELRNTRESTSQTAVGHKFDHAEHTLEYRVCSMR